MSPPATLYYDLGSPYAYLAVERAGRTLGAEPRLQPVLLGAIFALRGRGSWSQTPERAAGMAEVERRAREYELPPLRWPDPWPTNTLRAMRAATFADQQGAGRAFALAAFRRAFAQGDDLADLAVLEELGATLGLDVPAGIERPEVKDALRAATDDAFARGVAGTPTLIVGETVLYGDDQLERAVAS